MKVALIGAGRMGSAVGGHVAAAGHPLRVYDASGPREGFENASSVAEAAAGADLVLLCLPGPREVKAVAPELVAAPLVVDLTSSLPAVTRALDLPLIDAPMSGGVSGAESGSLALMVGGDEARLERARPVLETFSARIFHVGPLGAGHCVKAVNNALSAVSLLATSEVVAAVAARGEDTHAWVEAINSGPGRSQNSEVKFPRDILSQRFAAGFTIGLMVKDIDNAVLIAHDRRLSVPLLATTGRLWTAGRTRLGDGADFTEIYRMAQEWGSASAPVPHEVAGRGLFGVGALAAREAVAIFEAEGLEPVRCLEAINASSGRSEATRAWPRIDVDAEAMLASAAGPLTALAAELARC